MAAAARSHAIHPPELRVGPGPGPDSLWAGYTWEQLEALEAEGRVLITDHGGFVLINVYGCVHTRLCSVFASVLADFRHVFWFIEKSQSLLLGALHSSLLIHETHTILHTGPTCRVAPARTPKRSGALTAA